MANVMGFDQQSAPQTTLLSTLGNMAMSNFVSAKMQSQHGTKDAYQRITNTTKQKALDTAGKQNPLQNQPANVPSQSTNLGNCQGVVTRVFFTKDTPA